MSYNWVQKFVTLKKFHAEMIDFKQKMQEKIHFYTKFYLFTPKSII